MYNTVNFLFWVVVINDTFERDVLDAFYCILVLPRLFTTVDASITHDDIPTRKWERFHFQT